jgi:6-phosphofructokinase 1
LDVEIEEIGLKMKRIGVLTSGGDSPGMNAAIRAVVRQGCAHGLEVTGIQHGLRGIFDRTWRHLAISDVGGILERGGTVLQTSRYPDFLKDDVQQQGVDILREAGIDGLIIIGGEGSLHAGLRLHEKGLPTVGVPATIDNDIFGTDFAIGVDTALNTIIYAMDRLRDTATSHTRAFVVEAMGRHCGYLALHAGIAGGAEAILVPEIPHDLKVLSDMIRRGYERGKNHAIIMVSEGVFEKNAGHVVAEYLIETTGMEVRLTVLGHIQRGGTPTVLDRLLASRLGASAVDQLKHGVSGVMVALEENEIELKSLAKILPHKKSLNPETLAR